MKFPLPVLSLVLGFGFCAAIARADLLVLQPGMSSRGVFGAVFRFAEADAAPKTGFRPDNESCYALWAGADGAVYVTANLLGYGLVYRYSATGEKLGKCADLAEVQFSAGATAADGQFYAATWQLAADGTTVTREIYRGSTADGAQPTRFIAAGAGGLTHPTALAIGPEGDLYVSDARAGVLRFDRATGAFREVVVPVGRGGLADAAGFTFGPDGKLYIASARTNAVLRFDARSGEFMDTFVAPGSGGLRSAAALAFGPDGHLYATNPLANEVLRYAGATGRPLGAFVREGGGLHPTSLAFTAPARLAAGKSRAPAGRLAAQ